MTTNLSEAAKSALISAVGREGAQVKANAVIASELAQAGLIGAQDGLTRKGTIVREKVILAALDEAFGA